VLGNQNPVAAPFYNFTVPEPVGIVGVVAPDDEPLLGLISLAAPALCAGNVVVALGSQAHPLATAVLGEVAAVSDFPAGALNLLTGRRAELLGVLAGYRSVDGIHAAGCSPDEKQTLELGAAENLKRVSAHAADTLDWYDDRSCQSPYSIEPFDRIPAMFEPLGREWLEDPDRIEREVLEGWKKDDLLAATLEARAEGEPFVFYEGPPTANGLPGIHHVLARALKDAVCRYQTMRGRRVLRKAGWDTHGLPVEIEVEKKLGIEGKEGIEAHGIGPFNQACRESVFEYREEWEKLSRRIGFLLDYERPYVTCEPDYIETVWFLLSRFSAAGLLERGHKVLPWCGRCGTGLSSHEVGQGFKDVEDPSVWVTFPLLDAPGELAGAALVAWTTTPWTLPSNMSNTPSPNPGTTNSSFWKTRSLRPWARTPRSWERSLARTLPASPTPPCSKSTAPMSSRKATGFTRSWPTPSWARTRGPESSISLPTARTTSASPVARESGWR